eukprot:TRINITY_DN373_c0_g1_i1.p1 TRINITY_DN373_c0_g1~~TRINITY_DN373_c0_g1_i1.p1  ORF type:complete len:346 (-),score=58.86 TRINITY_DN373_c0_g1_i1:31-1068(-)
MQELPAEIWIVIFEWLRWHVPSIVACGAVNKQWQLETQQDVLWRYVYLETLLSPLQQPDDECLLPWIERFKRDARRVAWHNASADAAYSLTPTTATISKPGSPFLKTAICPQSFNYRCSRLRLEVKGEVVIGVVYAPVHVGGVDALMQCVRGPQTDVFEAISMLIRRHDYTHPRPPDSSESAIEGASESVVVSALEVSWVPVRPVVCVVRHQYHSRHIQHTPSYVGPYWYSMTTEPTSYTLHPQSTPIKCSALQQRTPQRRRQPIQIECTINRERSNITWHVIGSDNGSESFSLHDNPMYSNNNSNSNNHSNSNNNTHSTRTHVCHLFVAVKEQATVQIAEQSIL